MNFNDNLKNLPLRLEYEILSVRDTFSWQQMACLQRAQSLSPTVSHNVGTQLHQRKPTHCRDEFPSLRHFETPVSRN